MKTRLSLLLKFSVQLAGISSVVEILASSFKDDYLAKVHDLQHLQESILKTKQVWLLEPSLVVCCLPVLYCYYLYIHSHFFVLVLMNKTLFS